MSALPPRGEVLGPASHDHPINVDEFRRLFGTELSSFIPAIRSGLLVPAPAAPSVIDPDDAGSVGVSTLWALSDHQHAFTSGAAAALTRTAASSEGSASTHARSDHGHATDQMAWGGVQSFSSTSNSAAYSPAVGATATTDHTVTYSVINGRSYEIQWTSGGATWTAAADWIALLYADGVGQASLWRGLSSGAGTTAFPFTGCYIYTAPSTASVVFDIRVYLVAGSGSITFAGSGVTPIRRRKLTVRDIGV